MINSRMATENLLSSTFERQVHPGIPEAGASMFERITKTLNMELPPTTTPMSPLNNR